MAIYYLDICFQ